jgi:hypothetical protein
LLLVRAKKQQDGLLPLYSYQKPYILAFIFKVQLAIANNSIDLAGLITHSISFLRNLVNFAKKQPGFGRVVSVTKLQLGLNSQLIEVI